VAERDGVLIDAVTTVPGEGDFDLAVVEARGAWPAAVSSLLGAVRVGGRLIVIAGERRGWLGHLRAPAEPAPPDSEIVRVLEAEGWTSARGIGGRDEVRFVEGFRR
jgi:protein-L-isoaspartate O-methyltransferase